MLEELAEMVRKHGDNRRSDIDPMPLSMDREDLIEERAIVITLTNDNYIRHLPAESFRMQNRGGKGMKGVQTKNEDFPTTIMTCFSKDRLLIFTNRPATKKDQNGNEKPYIEGRVYGLRAWETPQGSRTSRGGHIRNIIGLKEDETVVSIVPLSKELMEN
ncbi:MAG: DNA gyrase C-terminal beta-propeller domain-containing protein, partial [Candidatus Thermoplasmatota archaeon]|nr:DNA gyrase C-terminal beta-propeller domain-containing protein [Candidatus Thermoplasmatota archaeon]